MARPFRFAVQVSRAETAEKWQRVARDAENLGYSTLSMPDHFGDQLAPMPALMAAASVTTTLRVGALVFANDYKHPVVLAKEVASMDVLTGGRVELGLGAGWMRTDYDTAGLPYDAPGVRIARMVESLHVIKGLMADGPLTYSGKYYQISDLNGLPKSIQKPHPPILIGGGGQKLLTVAAQHADIVGVNVDLRAGAITGEVGANITRQATDQKVQWVREAAGSRIEQLELSSMVYIVVVTNQREAAMQAAGQQFGAPPEAVPDIPHILVGSVEEIVDTLEERRARWGFSYIGINGDSMRQFAPVIEKLKGK